MKKICVVTHCDWSSYGSMLQALGLNSELAAMGCESFIVKDSPKQQRVRFRPFQAAGLLAGMVRSVVDLPFYFGKKKIFCKGTEFIQRNLRVMHYSSYDDLKKAPPAADCYLAGSDQIWHPALCKKLFFLDFAPKGLKKISYAASMGVTEIPDNKQAEFSALLKNMDSYSVRETEMVPIVQKITQKEPRVNIDPTFLMQKSEWHSLETTYPLKKPYILVYAIYWNKALNAQLKALHQKTGLPIVSIQSAFRNIYANRVLKDVGPAEFLWLVENAEAVITSSFHGVAFSVIFNKKFSAVVNPGAKSRISSLLAVLGITTPEPENVLNSSIDYALVNEKIGRERARSRAYLQGEIFNG